MGIPPAPRLIEDILKSVPPRFGGKGVDFDTLRDVVGERLRKNPIHMSDIDELFQNFEGSHGGTISDVSMRHIMEVETMNKTNMSDDEVDAAIIRYELDLGIPVTDALTRSPDRLVDMVLSESPNLEKRLIVGAR